MEQPSHPLPAVAANDTAPLAAPPDAPDERNALLAFDPVPVRHRADGWTPERQRGFIDALADSGCVAFAAASVGMSEKSAHNLRKHAGAQSFNRAWEEAARLGRQRLASIAWQRAVEGVEVPYYFRGELVGTRRVFSDKLLLFLLAQTDRKQAAPSIPDEKQAAELDRLCLDRVIDEDGLRTDFPPPAGFDGEEDGEWGLSGYWRTLTAAEEEAYRFRRLGPRARDCALRDRYFGFEGGDER